jgi:hypothetical protein
LTNDDASCCGWGGWISDAGVGALKLHAAIQQESKHEGGDAA